ncbi:hypothetical protein YQE_08713, partial [Dendroctonus ponderosae]
MSRRTLSNIENVLDGRDKRIKARPFWENCAVIGECSFAAYARIPTYAVINIVPIRNPKWRLKIDFINVSSEVEEVNAARVHIYSLRTHSPSAAS